MNYHSLCCVVFIGLSLYNFKVIKAIPQIDYRGSRGVAQQNTYRQGSIDEFLAQRPSNLNQNGKEPCIPQQFYPRSKRSPHFNRHMLRPLYPVNIYQQNINNVANHARPPYNSYGGYYCGNNKPHRPIQQPGHNNNPLWSHFPNIFGVGTNTNVIASAPPSSNVKPVHEANDHDNNPNEVSKFKDFQSKTINSIQFNPIEISAD